MNGALSLSHREFSRKGGAVKTEKKLVAVRRNLAKANAAKATKRAANGKP
ncbi:MAG: hypothetical protein WBL40_17030 [Terrimicrobiaceae bacterium]